MQNRRFDERTTLQFTPEREAERSCAVWAHSGHSKNASSLASLGTLWTRRRGTFVGEKGAPVTGNIFLLCVHVLSCAVDASQQLGLCHMVSGRL